MTPEQQRIAIAEACGWKRGHTGVTQWVNDPNGIRMGWSSMRDVSDNALPDYLNDLNAMHAAVSSQSQPFRAEFDRLMHALAEKKHFFITNLRPKDWADCFMLCLQSERGGVK
jgi:hypothetical protein